MLAAIPEAAGTCRSILHAALRARGLAGLADDAGTVVTELASNAVRATRAEHAAGGSMPVIVLVLGWHARGVRIEVWDRAPGLPRMCEPDWGAERGRGLFLIHHVTHGRWGYDTVGAAKCVWAELKP